MDCLFNLQIPKSNEYEYIVRPRGKGVSFLYTSITGKTFITGLASSYSFKYDAAILKNYISKDEFEYMITCFNEILFTYWPCPLCFGCGYIFSPCTLGINTCL